MTDKSAVSQVFLNATAPLTPKDAVAAVIVDEENRVLLQLRDDREDIFFPNHWGCFGGAMEPGEEPQHSLIRELQEELGIAFPPDAVAPFINVNFNTRADSRHATQRYFFIVKTDSKAARQIRLGEGRDFEFFTCHEVMRLANVTPYDKLAVWIYFNQSRLAS